MAGRAAALGLGVEGGQDPRVQLHDLPGGGGHTTTVRQTPQQNNGQGPMEWAPINHSVVSVKITMVRKWTAFIQRFSNQWPL